MMKRSHLSENKSPTKPDNDQQSVQLTKVPTKLLERLSSGKKTEVSSYFKNHENVLCMQVDIKEMKKLTLKNFQNLPEIKQRQEEERKQKEL